MNYCPECGNKLKDTYVDFKQYRKCSLCGFIDWDNWVNISCVTVAYLNSFEFLMVLLKENGKLTFPGGYRDLNETLEQAAKREFYEETGMKLVKDLTLYKTYTDDEKRLVWITYKTKIDELKFIENNEVEKIIIVNINDGIDETQLRGNLTKKLYLDIIKNRGI